MTPPTMIHSEPNPPNIKIKAVSPPLPFAGSPVLGAVGVGVSVGVGVA